MEQFNQQGGLQGKVGDYASPNIPPDLQWEQMSAGILAGLEPKRKRKRAFWLFWLLPGLLICSGGLYAYLAILNYSPSNPIGPISEQIHKQKQATLCPDVLIEDLNKDTPSKYKAVEHSTVPYNRSSTALSLLQQQQLLTITKSQPVKLPIQRQYTRLKLEVLDSLTTAYDTLIQINYPLNIPTRYPQNKNSDWQVELGVAVNSFDNNYKAREYHYETTLMGWQANIRLQRRISQQWHIQSGLQWQQLRYRSNLYHEALVNLYRPGTIDTIYTNQHTGEQSFAYRDSLAGIRTREFQHYNRHYTLQLPLLVAYERAFGAWKISLRTGLNLQLYKHSKGRTPITATSIINLAGNDYFDKRIRWSTLLELQTTYHFSPKAAIFTRLGGEQHLRNWLKTDLGYTQHPCIIYGSLGLRWSL